MVCPMSGITGTQASIFSPSLQIVLLYFFRVQYCCQGLLTPRQQSWDWNTSAESLAYGPFHITTLPSAEDAM